MECYELQEKKVEKSQLTAMDNALITKSSEENTFFSFVLFY